MEVLKKIIIVYILSMLFFQGLYFSIALIINLVIGIMLLGSVLWLQKEIRIPKTFGFYYFVMMIGLNGMGMMTAMEKGMMIYGLFQSIFFVVVYLLIYQIESPKVMIQVKWGIILTVMSTGLFSVFSYVFDSFPSLNYVINRRISGPLQYANSSAILYLGVLLLFLTMKMINKVRVMGIIALTIPLILTMSRSTLLIGFVAVVIMIYWMKPNWSTYVGLGLGGLLSFFVLKLTDINQTFTRVTEIGFQVSEWQTRLLYYKDALGMIMDRWTGYGYYGYYYAQQTYQTGSTYHVKYVHSSLLQAGLDNGVIGVFILGLFMVYLIFIKSYPWEYKLIVAAILAHSVIDIDLSFPYLWVFIILLSMNESSSWKKTVNLWHYMTLGIIVIMASYFIRVEVAFNRQDYRTTLNLYPYHTEALRKSLTPVTLDDFQIESAKTLVKYNPYIWEAYQVLKLEALKVVDYKLAVESSRKMMEANPLNINQHEQYSDTLLLAGRHYIENQRVDEGFEVLKELLRIQENVIELAKEKNTYYNLKHKPELNITDVLARNHRIAQDLMKSIEEK